MTLKLINNSERIVNLGCKNGVSVVVPPKGDKTISESTEKLFRAELLHYVGNHIIQAKKVNEGVVKDTANESNTIKDTTPKRATRRRRKSE